MTFILIKRRSIFAENPDVSFRDLRNRKVEGLLSQQAGTFRNYMEHADRPTVALQILTGKTTG